MREVRWKGKVIWEKGGGWEYNELRPCLSEQHFEQPIEIRFVCMLSLQQSYNNVLAVLSVQTNIDLVTGKAQEKILTLRTTQMTKPHIQVKLYLLTVRKPPEIRIWAQYLHEMTFGINSNNLNISQLFLYKTPDKSYYNLMDNCQALTFFILLFTLLCSLQKNR